MSNDGNNIIWTPKGGASISTNTNLQTDTTEANNASQDYQSESLEKRTESTVDVNNLQKEIEQAFEENTRGNYDARDDLPSSTEISDLNTQAFPENQKISSPFSSSLQPPDVYENTDPVTNEKDLLEQLEQSIHNDFEQIEDTLPTKGLEKTYYQDVSGAMNANDPRTMSELIRQARYEEMESKILSPRSKKNILYIAGTLILLVVSIGLLSLLFGGSKNKVQFISGERVASIIYSNQDTGINVTGVEPSEIRQAIRKVIERKIPKNTLNQIYYVEQAGGNVVRRLGIKDILQKTQNIPPENLMGALNDEFMHGVYSTDKNYPFLILKTNSYDRAFEGMRTWEPQMIDDLSAYFDLPQEAGDRSLLEDGFEDDLIRNKTVRVVRFLPREVDRRGIFNLFGGSNNQNTNTIIPENTLPNESPLETETTISPEEHEGLLGILKKGISNFTPIPAFAQGSNPGTSWDITNQGGGNSQLVCYNNDFPGQIFSSEYENTVGYYCVQVLTGEGTINQISITEPICFNVLSGQRIQEGGNPQVDFCFMPYRCDPYVCRLNGVEVLSSRQGEPGVVCREERSTEFISYNDPRPKICRQFNDIINLQNINNANICFDQDGRYLPNVTREDGSMQGVTCIVPQNRSQNICLTHNGQIYNPDGPDAPLYDAQRKFCFQRLDNRTIQLDINNACGEFTLSEVQQKLAQLSVYIEGIAYILPGLDSGDREALVEAAVFLRNLSQQNVLQSETVRMIAFILQTVESILDEGMNAQNMGQLQQIVEQLSGGDQLTAFYIGKALMILLPFIDVGPIQTIMFGEFDLAKELRNIITFVKCVLGIANNLQWSTLGVIRPQGTIYAGQTLPEVTPIQQALVLLGLMDPVSVNGTLDLVTQDAISQFQLANGLNPTGIIDAETLLLINAIIEGNDALYGGEALIADYFITGDGTINPDGTITTGGTIIALGSYTGGTQMLQIILYIQGYDILNINGVFDRATCDALQLFQEDNGLEIADDITCIVSTETLEYLNDIIRENGYLGSGFFLNPQGYLQGSGKFEGTFGPGVFDYTVHPADADTLREGDIVLMYMFLDEQTILITRSQVVIDEVIQRRALGDIFLE